jgi:DNA-binding beta-propeller fold protein YncE
MRTAGALALLIFVLAASEAGAAPYSSVSAIGKTGNGIFRFPQAIAFDDSGVTDPSGTPGPYVYVGDQYSFLVQKFTRAGTFVRQWGGFGTATGRFGNASGDTVGGIGGIAVDGAGRVYVLDSYNDRIQQFTAGGTFQRSWGMHGTAPGQFDTGINGGIAIRGSSLFVADQDNHRVQRFTLDSAGAPVGTPATFGSLGSGPGQLDHPQGLGVDAGAVYVADDHNDRVVKFSHAGAYLGAIGTTGTAASQFRFPYDAGVDGLGGLYVADNNNHRVQEFDAATLAYRRRWGALGTAIGRFGYPRSLAGVKGDPAGGVFVGNTSNNRVDAFAPDATSLGSFGTNARGPGLFMQPKSAALGKDGSLWVADTFSDRVQKLTAAGGFLASYHRAGTFGPAPGGGAGEFRNPYGVAVDPAGGAVYVADTGNDRVQRFDGTTWTTVAGTTFNAPRGVAVDASGRLLVADTGNDRVLRLSGTTWSPVGSGFARPEAVTAQGASVYVADTGNARVLKLDGASGAVQRVVAGATQVREPEGVAVDQWGNVAVSDTGNDRILRFDPSGAAIDGFGGNGTGSGQLIKPAQVSLADGALLAADPFNNRIQRYVLSTFTLSAPSAFSVSRGGSGGSGTVRATPTGGFARPVALSLSGCPVASTCTLTTGTLTPSAGAYPTATLRVQAGTTTPVGSYTLRVTARTTLPTIARTADVAISVR